MPACPIPGRILHDKASSASSTTTLCAADVNATTVNATTVNATTINAGSTATTAFGQRGDEAVQNVAGPGTVVLTVAGATQDLTGGFLASGTDGIIVPVAGQYRISYKFAWRLTIPVSASAETSSVVADVTVGGVVVPNGLTTTNALYEAPIDISSQDVTQTLTNTSRHTLVAGDVIRVSGGFSLSAGVTIDLALKDLLVEFVGV